MIQSDQERVLYILKEIANMELIIAGKTKVDLENDLTLERAVSMTLQLIGEKIGKISDEFQEEHNEIEWHRIKGLRNRISHDYDSLDFEIIFTAATESLQELKAQLVVIDLSKYVNLLLPRNENDQSSGKKL